LIQIIGSAIESGEYFVSSPDVAQEVMKAMLRARSAPDFQLWVAASAD
jgi:hypothetical protein